MTLRFASNVVQMAKEAAFLDDLALRARGEVTIREAVQELKVWSEQTEFLLTEHKVRSLSLNLNLSLFSRCSLSLFSLFHSIVLSFMHASCLLLLSLWFIRPPLRTTAAPLRSLKDGRNCSPKSATNNRWSPP